LGISTNYDGQITYAGVANAITLHVTEDANGVHAVLKAVGGVEQKFDAADRDELQTKIEDYLKKEGAKDWAKFLREMNRRSVAGVTDGNPLSTTARLADGAFQRYAFDPVTVLRLSHKNDDTSGFTLRLEPTVGTAKANGFEGKTAALPITLGGRFNEHVGLLFTLTPAVRQIEDANIFNIGLELGLPITFLAPEDGHKLLWQVTPFAVGGVGGSVDLIGGGVIVGGGLASALAYQFGPVILSMGNEIVIFKGMPVGWGDYEFDPGISQQILKNGLKLTLPLGRHFYADAGIVHTKFLQDAAVDSYVTPSAGIGWLSGGVVNLRAGVAADLGDGWKGPSATLSALFYF
jgi:hypothetical protein